MWGVFFLGVFVGWVMCFFFVIATAKSGSGDDGGW